MKLSKRISAFLGNKTEDVKNEEKSAAVSPFVSQYLLGNTYSGGQLSPSSSMVLYELSDLIYTAVDLIAAPFSQMSYSLKDKKTGEYLTGPDARPLLELLENPGYFKSSTEVMYGLMASFLVTNSCYPILKGNVNFEPLEITFIWPNKASLTEDGNNRLLNITFSDNEDNNVYQRQLIPKRKTAVYQADSKLSETIQIVKILNRNGIYPSSPLSRIAQQAYSKYYGNMHNTSMLKNGSTPGGLWSSGEKEGMSQQQYEAFKQEIASKFSGPQNAGRNIVAPGNVKYESFALQTKDMDFVNLIDKCSEDIYNLYHIPLALTSPKTMTMSNFENSQTALYDMAVLPNAYMVLKRLGDFMLPRYKDGDRFELTFDEKTLPALRARMIETAKSMRDVAAYTDNEIRQTTGHEERADGDTVWKSATLAPAGELEDMGMEESEGEDEDLDE